MGTMQGHEHSKGMSKSRWDYKASVRVAGKGYGMGRVGEGRAHGVPKTELRFLDRRDMR